MYERRAIVLYGAVYTTLDTVRYSIVPTAAAASAAVVDVSVEFMQRILFSVQSCRGFRLITFALRSFVE